MAEQERKQARSETSEQAEADVAEEAAVEGEELTERIDGLSKENAEKFLAKSADERDSAIAAAKAAAAEKDPVVYTTKAGLAIRQSDGATLLALAKQDDARAEENAELKKDLAKANQVTADADLRKAAEDLKYLPGTVDTRMAMLKAIESIADPTERENARTALKAQNDSMASAFRTTGVAFEPEPGSPADELEKLTQEYATKNSVSIAKAGDAVLKTTKGAELYAKTYS